MRKFWSVLPLLLALVACAAPNTQTAAPKSPSCTADGMASWYGPQPGRDRMADGRRYDPAALTAAHRWLPLGTRVRVTDLETGRSVIVRITDRGPAARSRIIDLSRAAATALAMRQDGLAPVKIEAAAPDACSAWQAGRPADPT